MINSLQGMFLIATNKMTDPRFKQTVILICSHDEHGALGLVLTNHFTGVSFGEILHSLDLEYGQNTLPEVYCGGPVALDALFVLSVGDMFDSTLVIDGVFLGNDIRFLNNVAGGGKTNQMRFFLGYSGWGAGQLEEEISSCGWLVLPALAEDVFHCPPDLLWRRVTEKHGINIDLFNDISGNA